MVYGKHARGASRHDILSFSAFVEVCRTVFRTTPLLDFIDLKSCWDVDAFVADMHHKSRDRKIKDFHGVMELSIQSGGDVHVRCKPSVGARIWTDPLVLLQPSDPDVVVPESHDKAEVALSRAWPNLEEKIASKLLEFCSNGDQHHIVHIPPAVRVEMCTFLRGHAAGAPGPPPSWPTWPARPAPSSDTGEDSEVEEFPLKEIPTKYVPFGEGVLPKPAAAPSTPR